jgi:Fur family transcriptional regulator, stress-responsive regulator
MAGPSPISDATLDAELTAALRARGHRVTAPRLLVHRHLRRRAGHVTPEQLHTELAPLLPSLSPATIYGTLDLLDDLGFVRRVSTPRGATVYDARVAPHHHVICRSCGRIQDIDATVDSAAAEHAALGAGFTVDHGQLLLTGLCSECANGPVEAPGSGPRDHAA